MNCNRPERRKGFLTLTIKDKVPFSFWAITILCRVNTNWASLETPGEKKALDDYTLPGRDPLTIGIGKKSSKLPNSYGTLSYPFLLGLCPHTRRELERDRDPIVDGGSFRPEHLRVQGVQDIQFHVLEEVVALVLEDDGDRDLAVLLEVALNVVGL